MPRKFDELFATLSVFVGPSRHARFQTSDLATASGRKQSVQGRGA